MAKETRHLFDLSDIVAIRLHCNHCGRDAVQSLKATDVPKKCPLCGKEWEVDPTPNVRGDNWQLIHAMQGLVKAATENPGMTVRFESTAMLRERPPKRLTPAWGSAKIVA